MGRICCVPGCKSGSEVPSHRFPKDPERCLKWIESLKMDHLKKYASNQLQKNQVCYKHFHPEDYSPCLHKRVLLNVAIPVLFIYNSVDAEPNKIHATWQQSVIDMQNSVRTEYAKHSQDPQRANNKDMSAEESNNFEEHNIAIGECGKLMDYSNRHEKACESLVSKQDNITSVCQNYENRLEALEIQMKNIQNTIEKQPQLQEITQSKNLSHICKRLFEMNIIMKRRNRYLKRLIISRKKKSQQNMQKKKTVKKSNRMCIHCFK